MFIVLQCPLPWQFGIGQVRPQWEAYNCWLLPFAQRLHRTRRTLQNISTTSFWPLKHRKRSSVAFDNLVSFGASFFQHHMTMCYLRAIFNRYERRAPQHLRLQRKSQNDGARQRRQVHLRHEAPHKAAEASWRVNQDWREVLLGLGEWILHQLGSDSTIRAIAWERFGRRASLRILSVETSLQAQLRFGADLQSFVRDDDRVHRVSDVPRVRSDVICQHISCTLLLCDCFVKIVSTEVTIVEILPRAITHVWDSRFFYTIIYELSCCSVAFFRQMTHTMTTQSPDLRFTSWNIIW